MAILLHNAFWELADEDDEDDEYEAPWLGRGKGSRKQWVGFTFSGVEGMTRRTVGWGNRNDRVWLICASN